MLETCAFHLATPPLGSQIMGLDWAGAHSTALFAQTSQSDPVSASDILPYAVIFIIAALIGAAIRNWYNRR